MYHLFYADAKGSPGTDLASDNPGFTVDEDEATLGDEVVLPPFLEGERERIVAGLKPID